MPEGEMNFRRASAFVRELRQDWPMLKFDTWAIAQGLHYIRVEGPTTRGIVQVVLKTDREVILFRSFMAMRPYRERLQAEPEPGSARWNDEHRPFGPDTTMA